MEIECEMPLPESYDFASELYLASNGKAWAEMFGAGEWE